MSARDEAGGGQGQGLKAADVIVQVKDALAAVEKLHNHVLREGDGGAAEAKGKKAKAKGASSGTLLWARQVSGESAHLKKWRLILRNLPFNVRPYQRPRVTFLSLPVAQLCVLRCAHRPSVFIVPTLRCSKQGHVLRTLDMLAGSCGCKQAYCQEEDGTAVERDAVCWF